MKRFLFLPALLTLAALLFPVALYSLLPGEVAFDADVPSDHGPLRMKFHSTTHDEGCVGVEQYETSAIPNDTEGEVFIPDSIAFKGRNLPVCYVTRGSFHQCSRLTEVHLPSTLLAISDLAFDGCSALRRISFPASLGDIYPQAFIGCGALRRVEFCSAAPPRSYGNDTFDTGVYETATLVVPMAHAGNYLSNPLTYQFRYHAERIPLYNETQP